MSEKTYQETMAERDPAMVEKEDRKYEASLWKGLLVIGLLLLIYSMYHTAKDVYLVTQANCVEAEYRGHNAAVYIDESGAYHYYSLQGYDVAIHDNLVKLYYFDNMDQAIPGNGPMTWIKAYGVSILFTGISIWRLRKIYHKHR